MPPQPESHEADQLARRLTGYGLVEAPLDRCVERLLTPDADGRPIAAPAADAPVTDPLHATRDEAVAFLSVLTHPATRRVLLAVNDRWTAVVTNLRDGSDVADDQPRLGAACRARTCRVVDTPDLTRTVHGRFAARVSSPARIFDLRDEHGRTIRSVACALDGSRWTFETSGTPLAAEADLPYDARRKRDRFTSAHLHRLVASLGAGPPIADAFAVATRFVLTTIPGAVASDTCTPADADDPAYGYLRRGLGWVPHLETHAESVVWDLTRAVLLNPAREPEARPHLRAARRRLGRREFARVTAEAEQHLRRDGG